MIVAQNNKYLQDINFKTAKEFLSAISYGGDLYKVFDNNFIFRGHSSDKYKLQPTSLRRYMHDDLYPNAQDKKLHALISITEYGQIEAEARALFDFYKKCDDSHLYVPNEKRLRESFFFPFDFSILIQPEEWIAEEYLELAALAQHYGVSTRLLDWTSDICVAIYFSSASALKKMVSPELLTWSMWNERSKEMLQKASEYFRTKEFKKKEEDCLEIWALDKRVQFADGKMAVPLRFVRPRYFNNENLSAQKGILSNWRIRKPTKEDKGQNIPDLSILIDDSPLDKQLCEYLEKESVKERIYLYRITLPYSSVPELYEYAKRNHCDASFLFPGYAGVAKCLKEDQYFRCLTARK